MRRALARGLIAGVLMTAASLAPGLRADDGQPAAGDTDADFIEFLGTVDSDSEDMDWVNDVAEADASKVAAAPSAPASADRSSDEVKKKDDR